MKNECLTYRLKAIRLTHMIFNHQQNVHKRFPSLPEQTVLLKQND